MYALIQENDIKSKKLAEEIKELELICMSGSTNLIPFHIIKQILLRKELPRAVILRYLNDSNSFIKSFIRFITNIVAVLIIKMLGIRLIWICHNVDRESKENYPLLVKIRRYIVTKLSDKVMVTDKYLIMHAAYVLKINESKLDYITFGEPVLNHSLNVEDETHQKIKKFAQTNKEQTIIGFSIGNPNVKVLQPFFTNKLIKKAADNGIKLKIILGGPLGDFIKKYDHNTYEDLLSNPDVLFLDGKVNIDENYISKYIDFYWRVYDDYSVPFTVYNAVYFNKPILTMNKGFLKEMVLEYDLGSVLDNDLSNIVEAIEDLMINRTDKFNEFVESHNWSFGAYKLYRTIIN